MNGSWKKLGQLALTLLTVATVGIANYDVANAATPTPPTLTATQQQLLEEYLGATDALKLPESENSALNGLKVINAKRPPATKVSDDDVKAMLPWLRATGDLSNATLRPYPSTAADPDYGMKLGIHIYDNLPGSLAEAEETWKGFSNWDRVRARAQQEAGLKWAAGQLWRLEDFGPKTSQGMIDWLGDLSMGNSSAYVLVAYARRLSRSSTYVTGFRSQGGAKGTGAPKYLTEDEGDARYSPRGHAHPHNHDGEYEKAGACAKCTAPAPAAKPAAVPVP